MMKTQQKIFARYASHIKPGRLEWIGLRPAHKAPMISVKQAEAIENRGLNGDHRMDKTPGSSRQVTLISTEYIQQIEHFSGVAEVLPSQLRRNLVVSGINLSALRYQRFKIGSALFEATALCHPCPRMEKTVAQGALVAMLGHGGICARILNSGSIAVGDVVEVIDSPQHELF